jgi:hypothetical protein
VGENPNGTWTLTVSDDTNLDGGTLNSWSLGLTTSVCSATPPPDTAVTGASATAPAKQSAGNKVLAVSSTVAAATEALTVKVDGVLTVKGKPKKGHHRGAVARDHSYLLASQTFNLASGTQKTVSSGLNGSSKQAKKLHKKLLKALGAKQKASVVLTFTFTDAAGNHKTVTQTVKLKAPKPKHH